MPTPPSSPLSPWSSPLTQIPSPPLLPILSPLPVSPPLPQISLLPLPVSSPVPVLSPSPPASPIRPLGYRAAMIQLRAETTSTSHSLPLPPPIILSHTRLDAPSSGSPPLYLLSTDRRADRPEVTLPPQKRLGIALGPRYEVGESSSAAAARLTGGLRADYGFVATIDREIIRDLERDVGYEITDTWDEMLVDMPGAPATDDTEMGIGVHMLVVAQQAVITELQAADCGRQATITEMLAADRRRQKQFIETLKLLKRLQTQMTEFERQQGPAKGPTQLDAPEEAGSSS
ncbi:hypothetical protein Tco_0627080 [Tanacetum coccineum]|uniref:Uncharacterized protein n=1 Tax=Tanacetum coccineum TaxID=301880 RepID=A0ABQ4WLJ2_9ASTR